MNDIFSSSFRVLAHGGDVDCIGGILLLSIMSIVVWGSLIFRKFVRMPKGLFLSSVIPYVLVSVFILNVAFGVKIPDAIVFFCLDIAFYPCSHVPLILGINSGLFLEVFMVDTLIIFGLIRLILYIKQKITAKNRQVV